MSTLIRMVVAGLSLCGVLAVLPGVAEAREPNRPAVGHIERGRGRDFGREHGRRFEGGRWHDGRERYGYRWERRPGC